MVTLEQKVDLIMRYAATDDAAESSHLLSEIRKIISDSDATPEATTDIPSRTNGELMSNTIANLFKELGAPCHLTGYDLATYAIELVVSDNGYIHDMNKRLYPTVAQKFNKTPTRVERAIRHLVEVTWNRHDIKDAYRVFGNTIDINRGKPTNSEFIACCAKEVERRMRYVM